MNIPAINQTPSSCSCKQQNISNPINFGMNPNQAAQPSKKLLTGILEKLKPEQKRTITNFAQELLERYNPIAASCTPLLRRIPFLGIVDGMQRAFLTSAVEQLPHALRISQASKGYTFSEAILVNVAHISGNSSTLDEALLGLTRYARELEQDVARGGNGESVKLA